MDCDLASLPDDLLDVRQDLSQYSYDPADMPDLGDDQAGLDSQVVSSQQSSQASYKLGDSLPFGDAGFDADADLFDFDDPAICTAIPENEVDAATDHGGDVLKFTDASALGREEICLVEANGQPVVGYCTTAIPPDFEFFGNNTAFDVKTEPSETSSPPAVSCPQSVLSYSSDSTSNLFMLSEEASESQLCISDNDLLTLSTRELNRRIRLLSLDEQRKLKNRRRTLKNRGYAQTCRTRRVGQKNELETENERLTAEVEQLAVDKSLLLAECDRMRKERVDSGGEVEKLRASNKLLATECDRLRQELSRSTAERDLHKSRLELLLNFFTTNGIVVEEEPLLK